MFQAESGLRPPQVFRQDICLPPAACKTSVLVSASQPWWSGTSVWCSFTLKHWSSIYRRVWKLSYTFKNQSIWNIHLFISKNGTGGLAGLLRPSHTCCLSCIHMAATLPYSSGHFLWHIKVKLLEDRNNMSIVGRKVNIPFQSENYTRLNLFEVQVP